MPQDYAEALKWYRLAAEQGNLDAQYSLGVMYHNGEGVPVDYAEALKWFGLAVAPGRGFHRVPISVSCTIGCSGWACLRDYAEALKGYRRSAEQGDLAAQYMLGLIYDGGFGVPQDHAEALKWYRRSAEQGNVAAQYTLGSMYDGGGRRASGLCRSGEVVSAGCRAGPTLAPRSTLGFMYYNGEGVPKDYVQSHMWLNLSAYSGDEEANELSKFVAEHMTPRSDCRGAEARPRVDGGVREAKEEVRVEAQPT